MIWGCSGTILLIPMSRIFYNRIFLLSNFNWYTNFDTIIVAAKRVFHLCHINVDCTIMNQTFFKDVKQTTLRYLWTFPKIVALVISQHCLNTESIQSYRKNGSKRENYKFQFAKRWCSALPEKVPLPVKKILHILIQVLYVCQDSNVLR